MLGLPCSLENEEVPHGEKDQGRGGPAAEVGERSVAERDRLHRPRLEAPRPVSAPVPKRDIGGAVSRYLAVLKRANTHTLNSNEKF